MGSPRTLEKHRTYGTGPTYRKLGGRIVYAADDLKIWADRGVRHSTTDPGSDTIYPAKRRENDLSSVVRPHPSQPTARSPTTAKARAFDLLGTSFQCPRTAIHPRFPIPEFAKEPRHE